MSSKRSRLNVLGPITPRLRLISAGEQADAEQPRDRPQPELAVISIRQDRDDQHLREAQHLERRGRFAEQCLHANRQVRRQHAVLRQVAARTVDHAVHAHQRHAVGGRSCAASPASWRAATTMASSGSSARLNGSAAIRVRQSVTSDVSGRSASVRADSICHSPRQPTILLRIACPRTEPLLSCPRASRRRVHQHGRHPGAVCRPRCPHGPGHVYRRRGRRDQRSGAGDAREPGRGPLTRTGRVASGC